MSKEIKLERLLSHFKELVFRIDRDILNMEASRLKEFDSSEGKALLEQSRISGAAGMALSGAHTALSRDIRIKYAKAKIEANGVKESASIRNELRVLINNLQLISDQIKSEPSKMQKFKSYMFDKIIPRMGSASSLAIATAIGTALLPLYHLIIGLI